MLSVEALAYSSVQSLQIWALSRVLLCLTVAFRSSRGETTAFVDSQCGSSADCCRLKEDTCNLSDLPTLQSTLIFPGGETRCIASNSTDYAFEVRDFVSSSLDNK